MLQCSGARTCADLSWTTRVVGGMLFNCTGSDACARSAFINNGSAILRCGQGSCEGLTLDVTCGSTVNCQGSQSCKDYVARPREMWQWKMLPQRRRCRFK